MKEQMIFTHIGSEVGVNVYFDYQTEEPAILHPIEDAYPGCPPEVILNAVYVDGSKERDVLEVLNDLCLSMLEEECEQSVLKAAKEEHERQQEER